MLLVKLLMSTWPCMEHVTAASSEAILTRVLGDQNVWWRLALSVASTLDSET